MTRIATTVLLCLLPIFAVPALCQKPRTVAGTYVYHAPENVSPEEARRIALDRAKIQALAEAFGTIVSQTNTTSVRNQDGHSDVDFLSVGGSEVKGEWIETLGEPQYEISYEEGMLVVKASVRGKAREITSAPIGIRAKLLRNGTDDRFESAEFHEGDALFLSFQSPVDGYLVVYLLDASQSAYCLLPYRQQSAMAYPVKANRNYLFFSAKDAPREEAALVDEYFMTCDRSTERNQLYVVFSPHEFCKPVGNDAGTALPRTTKAADFQEWLAKNRKHDAGMQNQILPILITNGM